MADEEEDVKRPSWVWASDGAALEDDPSKQRPISILAIAETITASALGLWVWFHWGLFPLLLSSLVMAFLTMLRCPQSVALGAKWFLAYTEDTSDIPLRSWRGAAIILLSAAITCGVIYWLALVWVAPHEGWAAVWRSAVLGLLALNISLAAAAAAAVAVAAALAAAAAAAGWGAVVGAGALVLVFIPGFAFGLTLRALATRALATLRYLHQGVQHFPQNWTVLVTTVDVKTEPELVPGLQKENSARLGGFLNAFKDEEDIVTKFFLFVIGLIAFLPSYIYRLTLKSTFLFYWPLLFIASAPGAVKTPDGGLNWDDATGRRLIDWIGVVLAAAALAAILHSIYDNNLYQQFVDWADPRGLPSHVVLQAISFQVWQLDLWEWCALGASAVTVITFLWANAINIRHRGKDRRPGWIALKGIYGLRRLQVLLVAATVLASFVAMLWFVHDTCTLPGWISDLLARILGDPQGCYRAP